MNKNYIILFIFSTILLPNIKVIPGMPLIRPEIFVILTAVLLGKAKILYKDFVTTIFRALMFLALISISSSYLFFDTPFNYSDFIILPMLVQYLLVYCFARSIHNPSDRVFAVKMVAVFIGISALIGIFQKFNLAGVNNWLTTYYLTREQNLIELLTNSDYGRIVGTVGDPRHYACILSGGMAAILSLILYDKSKKTKIISAVIGLLSIAAVIFTASRTGILAYILVFLAGFYFQRKSARRLVKYLFLGGMGLLLFLGILEGVAPEQIKNRILITDSLSFKYSMDARKRDFKEPFVAGLRNPLIFITGRGPSKAVLPGSEHTDVGWMTMRYGLLGLVCYMSLIFKSARIGTRFIRRPSYVEDHITFTFGVMLIGVWFIFLQAESIFKNGQLMSLNLFGLGMIFAAHADFKRRVRSRKDASNL